MLPKSTEITEDNNENKKNPYLEYGTAFENFFSLERSLMKMFLFLTILSVFQMSVFASYKDILYSGLFE